MHHDPGSLEPKDNSDNSPAHHIEISRICFLPLVDIEAGPNCQSLEVDSDAGTVIPVPAPPPQSRRSTVTSAQPRFIENG